MKVKRMISALAALAMSVSCLAGLTITASAADERVVFIGTAAESDVTAETFTGYSDDNKAKWKYKYDAGDEVAFGTAGVTWNSDPKVSIKSVTKVDFPEGDTGYTDGSYPTYVDGDVLSMTTRSDATASAIYTMDQAVGNGAKLYFSSDVALYLDKVKNQTFGELTSGAISLTDSAGESIVSIPITQLIPDRSGYTQTMKLGVQPKDGEKKTVTGTFGVHHVEEWTGFHIDLTIDFETNKASAKFDFMDEDNSNKRTVPAQEINDISIPAGSSIEKLTISALMRKDTTGTIALDNTKLYADIPQMDSSYKVEYKLADGTEIIEPDVIPANTGTATAVGKKGPYTGTKGDCEGKTYYYVSDNQTDHATVEAENATVITVTVREQNTAVPYTVNPKFDGTTTDANITFKDAAKPETAAEGEALTVICPRFIMKDGVLYEKSGAGNQTDYKLNVTIPIGEKEATQSYSATIDYVKASRISNFASDSPTVVELSDTVTAYQYIEAEDIADVTKSNGGRNTRFSNNDGGYLAAGSKADITTLPKGKYKIYSANGSGNTNTFHYKVNCDGETVQEVTTATQSNAFLWSDEFEVTGAGKLELESVAHSGGAVDFFLIVRTAVGDPEAAAVDVAPWSGLNPVTGSLEGGPTFEDLKNGLETKIFAVTVYDEKADVPTLTITNYDGGKGKGVAFDPGWKTVAKNGARIFYIQFMATAENFAQFGKVTATYGEKTLDLTLTE